MLRAYTMPPKADHVKMPGALVKLNPSHAPVDPMADDIAAACDTLARQGGALEPDRPSVKPTVGS
jgi:glutamate decarboxylase